AAGLSLLLLRGAAGGISVRTVALGAVTGADYVLGFLILMAGIARGPLAVPVTVMRLSVAVPVAASIFLWSESPRPAQWAGLAAGIAAIVLFGLGIGRGRGRSAGAGFLWLMAAMFMVMGLGDVLLKAFRETAPDSQRLLFTFILFGSAALFTWLLILAGRRRISRPTVLLGLLLGLPNLLSTVFTLLALRSVPASIAFPFINLAVIFGSTILGRAVWRERLGRTAAAGLAAAALALVLLRL
ncbi:MAG: EamA family transporter, partial [Candidatus Krumholzibacteria bacterium]|nr:EamA family transporter [Candidatus Krumholzibacteria bacterium]